MSIREALRKHDDHDLVVVSIRTLFEELAEMEGVTVNEVAKWMLKQRFKVDLPPLMKKANSSNRCKPACEYYSSLLEVVAVDRFEGGFYAFNDGVSFYPKEFELVGFYRHQIRAWLKVNGLNTLPPCLEGQPDSQEIRLKTEDELLIDDRFVVQLPWARQFPQWNYFEWMHPYLRSVPTCWPGPPKLSELL